MRWLALALFLGALSSAAQGFAADRKPPTRADLRQALQRRHDFDFRKAKLDWALGRIGDALGAEILLDRAALVQEGLDPEALVSLSLKGQQIESTLSLLLRPLGLTHVVCDGYLKVTTYVDAEEDLQVQVHDISDLVVEDDFDSLIEIVMTQRPHSWTEMTGPPPLYRFTTGNFKALVFSQTPDVHDQVAQLLSALRGMRHRVVRPQGGTSEVLPTRVVDRPYAIPDAQVLGALARRMLLGGAARPLEQALEDFSKNAGIPVLLDRRSLEDEKIACDESTVFPDIEAPAGELLREALRPLKLTFEMRDNLVIVTTAIRAEEGVETRIYDTSDFIRGGVTDDSLEEILRPILPRNRGSFAPYHTAGIDVLVISQSQGIHARIERLFGDLRQARAASAAAQPSLGPPPAASSRPCLRRPARLRVLGR